MTSLSGKRILVTRAPHQASELADRLCTLGATPILIPTIEIGAPASFAGLDAALGGVATFDLVAFTSANAVEAFQQRAQLLGVTPALRRIAAVGSATARALECIGLHVDVLPPVFTAESLAETLAPEADGRQMLLVLAEDAPATLRSGLEAAGARVTVAAAYRNRIPETSLVEIAAMFASSASWPHAITFTSGSTARNLAALLEAAGVSLPGAVVRASIGPITSAALRELGLPPHVEASESTISSLVASLASYFQDTEGDTVLPMTEALLKTGLLQTNLGSLPLLARGKVRDLYALGDDLLFVATDRISAFDHVLATGIPDKGKILTQISEFWFDFLKEVVPNHLLPSVPPETQARLAPFAEQLAGRSMIVRRARMFPVECVVRGYLSGSGWKDYRATGAVCGIELPAGMRESEKLPEAIFTPAAKVNTGGHDENISYAQMEATVGADTAAELRWLTLAIYAKASEYASSKGLILADTKFEFGWVGDSGDAGHIVLADEVLTPDSSRYWPAESYAPGGPQMSFDKQFVRDYLESIGWNKQAPAPGLPGDVVSRTREKYLEAFRLLTGRDSLLE